jgi:antitoxin ParD1/3/4
METITISVSEPLRNFIEAEVATGGYQSASAFVERLVHDAQQRKEKREVEQRLLEALASGEATPMTAADWEAIRSEVRERHTRRNGS